MNLQKYKQWRVCLAQLAQSSRLRLVKEINHHDRLHKRFGPIFKRNEEWGLAIFLLHEFQRGEISPWYHFIKTLKMRVLRTDVLKELKGTYFTQDHRDTIEESESITHMVTGQHLKSSTTDRDLTICKGHRG